MWCVAGIGLLFVEANVSRKLVLSCVGLFCIVYSLNPIALVDKTVTATSGGGGSGSGVCVCLCVYVCFIVVLTVFPGSSGPL